MYIAKLPDILVYVTLIILLYNSNVEVFGKDKVSEKGKKLHKNEC